MPLTKSYRFVDHDRSDRHETFVYDESLTPASVGANSIAQESFSVPGARTGDVILAVSPPASLNVGVAGFRIDADDSVELTFVNPTAGALSPTSGTWRFVILR